MLANLQLCAFKIQNKIWTTVQNTYGPPTMTTFFHVFLTEDKLRSCKMAESQDSAVAENDDWSTGLLDCCGGDGFGKAGDSAGATICEFNLLLIAGVARGDIVMFLVDRQRGGLPPRALSTVVLWLLRILVSSLLSQV